MDRDIRSQAWLPTLSGQINIDHIQEHPVPAGTHPHAIAPDPNGGIVCLSGFGSNSIVRFDPGLELFTVYELLSPNSAVRQILGRPGEVWGAASGADTFIGIRTGVP